MFFVFVCYRFSIWLIHPNNSNASTAYYEVCSHSHCVSLARKSNRIFIKKQIIV